MDKKKIVFIEPMGAPSNVFSNSMNIPLLGPVYLATIAKQAGYNVSIFNENIIGRKIKADELKSIDTLLLSCITATVERGKEIAKEYKSIRKSNNLESKVAIGGIHASMLPNDVINDFDQVIVGESENIILDLLSDKVKDKIINAKRPENLDDLPSPNFKLIKGQEKIKTKPVMTSRGCPYNCNFCSVTEMFGRNYRTQNPSRVIEELLKYRKGDIFFVDDNFSANTKRIDSLLEIMIESEFNRPWSAQVRTDIAKNPKRIAKMKKAGCNIVYTGFESINQQSLNEMEKGQTVEDIVDSIKVFHDNGIMVHGMFILGNDSDTKDTFKMTSEFCNENNLDFVQYSILTPLPGTRLYKKLEKEGRLLHKKWQFYDGLHVVFKPNPKHMTPYELQQGIIKCFSDFYSYTNAIKGTLKTVLGTVKSTIKSLHTKVNLPSFNPSFMKFVGKRIIKDWIDHNKVYLEYLEDLSKYKIRKAVI